MECKIDEILFIVKKNDCCDQFFSVSEVYQWVMVNVSNGSIIQLILIIFIYREEDIMENIVMFIEIILRIMNILFVVIELLLIINLENIQRESVDSFDIDVVNFNVIVFKKNLCDCELLKELVLNKKRR